MRRRTCLRSTASIGSPVRVRVSLTLTLTLTLTATPTPIRTRTRFAGTVLHSSEYKDKSLFAGKRVLIVGCGETGMDLAYRAVQVRVRARARASAGVRDGPSPNPSPYP